MITELFFGKAFDEFYDKCKDFLKEKIFDKRKLDTLAKEIVEHHKRFSESNGFAQNSKFQRYVENNLKLYEQYNAICKIEPPYRTINEIQLEIMFNCISEFNYISKLEVKSYYKNIFELIRTTLYKIAQETDIGRSAIIIDETGQRIDEANEKTNRHIEAISNKMLETMYNIVQITTETKEVLTSQNIVNTSSEIDYDKHIFILNENRKILSHEMGQIAAGVRALNNRFSHYIFNKKIETESKYGDKISIILFNEIIKKAELYISDVQGQFDLINMMTTYYGDDVVPNIKQFDIWKEFFHKWHLVFNSQCAVNNKYLDMTFKNFEIHQNNMRTVTTDPILLQCILYNVVNNAIKYSYVNTKITVDFVKQIEQERYIFTVKNYGGFLDPCDHSIYERGVRRGADGMGLGLYWSALLTTKLCGKIHHECNLISKYNISLMEPFFIRYSNYDDFRVAWDKAYKLGFVEADFSEHSYSNVKSEYNNLKKNHIYEKIVNNWRLEKINNISFFKLYTDMQIPTYETTFSIEIPKFERR